MKDSGELLFQAFGRWFEKVVIPQLKHETKRWRPLMEYMEKQEKEKKK